MCMITWQNQDSMDSDKKTSCLTHKSHFLCFEYVTPQMVCGEAYKILTCIHWKQIIMFHMKKLCANLSKFEEQKQMLKKEYVGKVLFLLGLWHTHWLPGTIILIISNCWLGSGTLTLSSSIFGNDTKLKRTLENNSNGRTLSILKHASTAERKNEKNCTLGIRLR